MYLTQLQLVKLLGVSRGTLHRVLIGSPLVKPATRERILRELERLNYVPNAIAQGLRNRETRTFGVIGPATANASNAEKLTSLYLAAREQGYSIIFAYSDGSSKANADSIREIRSRMVDGVIAFGRGLPESASLYTALQKDGVPLVTLYPTPGAMTDCVHVDTRKAFYVLTEHLIKLGHREIGLLISSSHSLYIRNRELGFRDAMNKAKLSINEDWIARATPDGTSVSKGQDEEIEKHLWQISDFQHGFWGASLIFAKRRRPTALVCMTDDAAMGALRAADLAGISVPEELAVTGYDGREPGKYARVPLATMHQPDEVLGREAVSLLVNRIAGRLPAKPIVRALQAKMVIRESSGQKI